MENAASIYNKARHHALSLLNKNYSVSTIGSLIKRKYELAQNAFIGLLAELKFYSQYRTKYQLSAALDCGDKADFIGLIDGKIARIDVTTNLHYKKLDDYNTPIDNSGLNYYLAHMDYKSGNLIDIVSLNVPCTYKDKEHGRLVDLAILHGPDYDKDGCCRYNPYQELLTVDTIDCRIVNRRRVEDWYIEDMNTFISNIPDEMDDQIDQIIDNYGFEVARFLNKTYNVNILGCIAYEYHVLTPDGDGDYGYYLRWLHPLLVNSDQDFKLNEEIFLD